jgi:hypothetical protein
MIKIKIKIKIMKSTLLAEFKGEKHEIWLEEFSP